jgi:pSer/pThr/pTyr-binding forkhead associated (FHA) protein
MDEMRRQVSEYDASGSASRPSPAEPAAELIRLDQPSPTPPIALGQLMTVIGSKADAHLRLRSRQVSGAHCVLVNMGHTIVLRDLASRTGVFVNDKRVDELELAQGDTLRIGRYGYSVNYRGAMSKSPCAIAPANATLRTGAGSIDINRRIFMIGRQRSADLHLDSELVSKAHAILVRAAAQWFICDLCSRSGTRVSGRPVQISELHSGDRIQIGDQQFVFDAEPATVEPIPDGFSTTERENDLRSRAGAADVDAGEPLSSAPQPSESDPIPPEQPVVFAPVDATTAQTSPSSAVHSRGKRNPKVVLDYCRPGDRNPKVICHGWGPLAAAVAEPQLLERIAASRRRAPYPGQQDGAPPKQAIEATIRPAWRPSPRQTIAIATGTATFLGAAWFVISHPHFLTQLW